MSPPLITAHPAPAQLRFEPQHDGYSFANACVSANLSSQAYEQPMDIQAWAAAHLACNAFYTPPVKHGTNAFLAVRDDAAFVFFRGTERGLEDWRTNLDIPLDNTFAGKVHGGFLQAMDAVWQDGDGIAARIAALCAPETPIWFAGHSLGGALAVLAASRAFNDQLNVAGVYTFGQPRTVGGDFAEWYNHRLGKRTFRFVNASDLVPRVPLRALHGYAHVGQFLYLAKDGTLGTKVDLVTYLADRYAAFVRQTPDRDLTGITDHHMGNYLAKLRNNPDVAFGPEDLHYVL